MLENNHGLDLDELGTRLEAEGPFTFTVGGKTYRAIGAGLASKLGEPHNNHLVGVEVNTHNQPCSANVTCFGTKQFLVVGGPYRLRVRHRLTLDELITMVVLGAASASTDDISRAGETALGSTKYYGVGPDDEAINGLLHRVYDSQEVWGVLGMRESLEFLGWYACGRPSASYQHNVNLALQAVIMADGALRARRSQPE